MVCFTRYDTGTKWITQVCRKLSVVSCGITVERRAARHTAAQRDAFEHGAPDIHQHHQSIFGPEASMCLKALRRGAVCLEQCPAVHLKNLEIQIEQSVHGSNCCFCSCSLFVCTTGHQKDQSKVFVRSPGPMRGECCWTVPQKWWWRFAMLFEVLVLSTRKTTVHSELGMRAQCSAKVSGSLGHNSRGHCGVSLRGCFLRNGETRM